MENRYNSLQRYEIPKVEHRGISIDQLESVYGEIVLRCVKEGWTNSNGENLIPEKVTLYDIKVRIIMSRTNEFECSYVELIAESDQVPTWFVSHWWGEPVIGMIKCLKQHAKDRKLDFKKSFYWICVSYIVHHS